MLKTYQDEAIKRLDTFCNDLTTKSASQSFKDLTNTQYLEIEGFDNPYVCIRIPTGGGKTLIATKSIRVLTNEYLNQDYSLVFWLAPTEAIVNQTLQALKNKQHFYRKVLDKEFDNIKVLSIAESFKQSFDPKEELVIIVGTIQSFRTTNKEGRKFFDENSTYYELLKSLDMAPSLENVMKLYKPIIILDEAHKASTGLSLKSLLDLNPSFILELTATPITKTVMAKEIYASNILYSVNATELKKEHMIKLPIMLKTIDDSMKILQEGIEKREYLEKLAILEESSNSRYIRPINLIRADENRGSEYLTYDKIKNMLIEDFKINEKHIAVHTGDKKELDGVDLLKNECEIRYIITVDALKEGWDCPFAYVLSVVSNMQSATAIEQLIGRVLRMPYIEPKEKKELEYSYVYVATNSFEDVASSIGKTLVNSGFEEMEAKISIDRSFNTNDEGTLGGLFGDTLYEERQFKLEHINIEDFTKPSLEPYININTGTNTVTIVNFPTTSKREKFFNDLKNITPNESHSRIDTIATNLKNINNEILSKICDIELPKLMIDIEDEHYDFEESIVWDYVEITQKELIQSCHLTLDEFDITLSEHLGIIDVNGNKVTKQEIVTNEALPYFEGENEEMKGILNAHKLSANNIDMAKLAHTIAKIIVDENSTILRGLDARQLKEFIVLAIDNLIKTRENIDLTLLISKKYQLKKAILKKLISIIDNAKNLSFKNLFEQNHFVLDLDNCVRFGIDTYMPNPDDRSGNFKKHKYQFVHKFDSEEEYQVAKYIDSLANITSWIRNIDKDYTNSFYLQTKEGKFFPDFVLNLDNGKTVVAEYKGKVYIPEYERVKKPVGDAWGSLDENYKFISLYMDNYKTVLEMVSKK
jgi:type III restriction enzyme